ncbi:MAG: APC family permease [Candidatus Eremiobacteraeota bacterium]|nr:APC family permease [Candidatus Eremiobacteraeota bacterium]MBV8366960.1 APC family permease [Candidatus Eremiobacteraeota bacterium]
MPFEGVISVADSGLRRNVLSFWEVTAQSVANIAPSATPALVVPLVYASAGNASWLYYAFATVALMFVAYNVNQFAKRSASPGSLYLFVSQGLGPTWGVLSGWSAVISYLIVGGSVLAGLANYAVVLAHDARITGADAAVTVTAMVVGALAAWFVAYRDIKLSAQFMLFIEFAIVGLILALSAAYFVKAGRVVDRDQFALSGLSLGSLRQGLVLAIFSFVGFESATALGHEAKDPLRTIPRAVMISVIAVGVLFMVSTYALVFAFRGQHPTLDQSNAPLGVLATLAGVPYLGPLIAVGVVISFFACSLACINAGARVLFAMSRHGLFHSSAGNTHASNATPHVAVTFAAIVVLFVPLGLFLARTAIMDVYGDLGEIGTLAVLFAYVLVSIAAPIYLKRRGEPTAGAIAISVISVALLAVPIYSSFFPPPSPWFLPYVFLALLALGAARFLYLRVRRPQLIRAIEADLVAS